MIKLLLEMYRTYSVSHKEELMHKIVVRELNNLGITDYKITKDLQIYKLIPNTPLLCAHMDQVSRKPLTELDIYKGRIFGNGNLGADDKNGVWINLQLLKEFPNTSFIFTTAEEAGGNLRTVVDVEDLSNILYGLIFDRRGSGDIIGTMNNYCVKEFEDAILNIGKKFGYEVETGLWSDCDLLSTRISCVNLSCGYYNAHTSYEHTVIYELINALDFGRKILSTLKEKFDKPIHKTKYNRFKNYYDDYDYWDYSAGATYSSETKTIDYDNIRANEYVYVCDNCNTYCTDRQLTLKWECPVCSENTFKYVGMLEEIYDLEFSDVVETEEYNDNGLFFCPKCKTVYEDPGSIPYYCLHCGYNFE